MVVENQLKKDSNRIGHFIHKLNERGKDVTAYKLLKKQMELNSTIMHLKEY